jgi:hypothetical protein
MNDEDRCPATNRDGERCGHPAGWGTNNDDGPCKFHGGAAENQGAPERNQNARKHGLEATPEYLVEHLDAHHEDTLIATFEGLCHRYERIHGHEADHAAKIRLRRISIELLKQDLADEWLAEQAEESGHLLMEQREAEDGREYEVPNAVLEPMTALKRETRLALKDMGLLQDPDTQQADATATLAEVIEQE